MGRRKKTETTKKITTPKDIALTDEQLEEIELYHDKELVTNPKYSLDVDPENKYSFDDTQKRFIKLYIEIKSIDRVCQFLKIPLEQGDMYFSQWATQQEIKRISAALYQRQFKTKILTFQQLESYLTAMLTGENVPLSERAYSIDDKIKIIKAMMDLGRYKRECYEDPSKIMQKDISEELKDLSVETIKSLISTNKSSENKNKEELMNKIDAELSPQETEYLKSLSTKELLEIIEKTNKEIK